MPVLLVGACTSPSPPSIICKAVDLEWDRSERASEEAIVSSSRLSSAAKGRIEKRRLGESSCQCYTYEEAVRP